MNNIIKAVIITVVLLTSYNVYANNDEFKNVIRDYSNEIVNSCYKAGRQELNEYLVINKVHNITLSIFDNDPELLQFKEIQDYIQVNDSICHEAYTCGAVGDFDCKIKLHKLVNKAAKSIGENI